MARKRLISTAIWNDPDFVTLDSSSKLLFLYLLTNEATSVSGIYIAPPIPIISIHTGISADNIPEVINGLKNVNYDGDSNTIFISNFLDYNSGGNPNLIEKAIANEYKTMKSSIFWPEFSKRYPEQWQKIRELTGEVAKDNNAAEDMEKYREFEGPTAK